MKKVLIAVFAVLFVFFAMGAGCENKKPEGKMEQAAVTPGAGEKIAVIETNKGVIKFKFFEADAPNTVANFIKLADSKFYDGLLWHRVEPGFVIQGGDPNGNGSGGPGYTIKAEFNKNPHLDGTVAMARANDPDSAGSQFYICLGPQPMLDGKYTVFGQVIEGLDVVHKIQVGDKMTKVYIETK
jgi:cyclophilin family peptidyl-prolyl cis-trans isomerase